MTFRESCEHLIYGLKSPVLRPGPWARVAAHNQLRDVGVSIGEVFQVVCEAVVGGQGTELRGEQHDDSCAVLC